MLYKQNRQKELSNELFKNPPKEYRGTPFWAWNCKIDREKALRQIGYFKEMGLGGAHIHVRDGLDTEYLSPEFMGYVKDCVAEAKKKDLLMYLYDEDTWPSGFAGGLVTKEKRYRARALYFGPADLVKTRIHNELKKNTLPLADFSEETTKKKAYIEGKPYFVASYEIELDSDGYLKSYRQIPRHEKAQKGEKWICFSCTEKEDSWFNGQTYLDTLDKRAVERFIEITHERYKAVVGEEFDKTIPSIFTDEPQYVTEINFETPFDKKVCRLPWTVTFEDGYLKRYGEDILDTLPEIFWDLPNQKPSKTKYRFHDYVCERFAEAFVKTIGNWCEKNRIKLTGHMFEEPTLWSQTKCIGEAMRAYRYFGYPGVDMLCNGTEYNTVKQTQSVVRQYGKEAMTSELYGVTDWDFDFRGHKFQGDWQAALGVSIRVQHLAWMSMAGVSKRDYPASIFYQSPWYREYSYVEDHFARLNTALTRGKADCKVAVLHPIESYWLKWGPNLSSFGTRAQLDENFENICSWLLFSTIDFDYICESLFPDECKIASNPLKVGKMQYHAVVVPPIETMRRTTFDRLKAFAEAGGKLIFMGDCPKYIDVCPSDELKALYEKSIRIPVEKNALCEALKDERDLEILNPEGKREQDYIYQLRKDGKYEWLFICRGKKYTQPHVKNVSHLTFKIKGAFEPILYDTLSGEIKDVAYTVENGYTMIKEDVYISDSFLFRLQKTNKKSKEIKKERKKTVASFTFKDSVPYTLSEDNVFLLDIAEYKYRKEEKYRPSEEILKIDKIARQENDIMPRTSYQPYVLKPEPVKNHIYLRYTVESEIDLHGISLAYERPEECEFLLDGKTLDNHPNGYFTDESIQKIPLPDLKAGTHTIEVKLPLASRSFTEWAYLTGKFGVKVVGANKKIVPLQEKLFFGSITDQTLPFYSGNVTYLLTVENTENADMLVHSHYYVGALQSVRVDGQEVGKIVYAPYTLKVQNVSAGKHTVEITLFGNRYNSFGVLHMTDFDRNWIAYDAWETEGDKFSYEYQLRKMGILSSPVVSFEK